MKKAIEIDFNDPDDCRNFLENLLYEGKDGQMLRVRHFKTKDGRLLTVDQMSDSELINCANGIYEEMKNSKKREMMN